MCLQCQHRPIAQRSQLSCVMQDTLKPAPTPSTKNTESARMKRATDTALIVTTTFYLAVGCLGYSAFGDKAPTNLLIVQHVDSSRTGFTNPYWLVDCANVFVMVNMLGGYQVSRSAQPTHNILSTLLLS